jgi:tRNA/rRNA methyltransferase
MSLERCRVVLVRPQVAGNLGATARVMRNMGLSQLVLVAPEADPRDRRARQLSTHGESILDRATIVNELGDAVADSVLVAGTSARRGGLFRKQSRGSPEDVMAHLVEALADHACALVFGPERTGLTNAEVSRCHYLIHIPSDPGYPALNLAQAVAVCLYELRRQWLRLSTTPAPSPPTASFTAQEHLYSQLRTALDEIHFLYGPKADALMHALRHLIGRARPTEMEVDVLRGLARQIRWYVANRGPATHPSPPPPPAPPSP